MSRILRAQNASARGSRIRLFVLLVGIVAAASSADTFDSATDTSALISTLSIAAAEEFTSPEVDANVVSIADTDVIPIAAASSSSSSSSSSFASSSSSDIFVSATGASAPSSTLSIAPAEEFTSPIVDANAVSIADTDAVSIADVASIADTNTVSIADVASIADRSNTIYADSESTLISDLVRVAAVIAGVGNIDPDVAVAVDAMSVIVSDPAAVVPSMVPVAEVEMRPVAEEDGESRGLAPAVEDDATPPVAPEGDGGTSVVVNPDHEFPAGLAKEWTDEVIRMPYDLGLVTVEPASVISSMVPVEPVPVISSMVPAEPAPVPVDIAPLLPHETPLPPAHEKSPRTSVPPTFWCATAGAWSIGARPSGHAEIQAPFGLICGTGGSHQPLLLTDQEPAEIVRQDAESRELDHWIDTQQKGAVDTKLRCDAHDGDWERRSMWNLPMIECHSEGVWQLARAHVERLLITDRVIVMCHAVGRFALHVESAPLVPRVAEPSYAYRHHVTTQRRVPNPLLPDATDPRAPPPPVPTKTAANRMYHDHLVGDFDRASVRHPLDAALQHVFTDGLRAGAAFSDALSAGMELLEDALAPRRRDEQDGDDDVGANTLYAAISSVFDANGALENVCVGNLVSLSLIGQHDMFSAPIARVGDVANYLRARNVPALYRAVARSVVYEAIRCVEPPLPPKHDPVVTKCPEDFLYYVDRAVCRYHPITCASDRYDVMPARELMSKAIRNGLFTESQIGDMSRVTERTPDAACYCRAMFGG